MLLITYFWRDALIKLRAHIGFTFIIIFRNNPVFIPVLSFLFCCFYPSHLKGPSVRKLFDIIRVCDERNVRDHWFKALLASLHSVKVKISALTIQKRRGAKLTSMWRFKGEHHFSLKRTLDAFLKKIFYGLTVTSSFKNRLVWIGLFS